jgi:hypothetical protein
MKLVLLLACLLAVGNAAAPFTGYVVTGQWDGRTWPDVEWALDVTRQDELWRPQQELVLQQMIPTTAGPALKPSYTCFDPKSRTYFLTTQRNNSAASLWGLVIANDVNSSKPLSPVEVRYHYPELDMPLLGLQVWNNAGSLVVLALFQNCSIMRVNQATGADSLFANVCTGNRIMTSAVDINTDTDELYIITQNPSGGDPAREIVTLDLKSGKVTSVPLAPLKNHNAPMESAFEGVWVASLKSMLVFYTGLFDQLIYTDPATGATQFAINDLAYFNGPTGHLEFTADDRLEEDDLWGDTAMDPATGKIWFQCSDVDEDGEITATLCQIQMGPKIKQLNYVNIAIWPMTYGYVGMQYVPVISE